MQREEMEYPLDDGEIASLDELFNSNNVSSSDEEEDALALLFAPEASESAIDEIRQQSGILYDVDAVDACLKAIEENEALIIQSPSKQN